MKITYTFAKRVVMVANSYLDFVSDTILLSAILNSLEYSLEPTKFASQVGLILLVSLIFPLLLSAITIAYKKPLVIVNDFIWSHFKETASAKKNKLILDCLVEVESDCAGGGLSACKNLNEAKSSSFLPQWGNDNPSITRCGGSSLTM